MDSMDENLNHTLRTELFSPLSYEAAKAIVERVDGKVQSQLEYDEVRLLEGLEATKEDSILLFQHLQAKSVKIKVIDL